MRRVPILLMGSVLLNVVLILKIFLFDPNYPLKVVWFDPAGFEGSWETRDIPEDLRDDIAAEWHWPALRIGEDRTLYVSGWVWITEKEMLWNWFRKHICDWDSSRPTRTYGIEYPCERTLYRHPMDGR